MGNGRCMQARGETKKITGTLATEIQAAGWPALLLLYMPFHCNFSVFPIGSSIGSAASTSADIMLLLCASCHSMCSCLTTFGAGILSFFLRRGSSCIAALHAQ
jgi:hypothetical protein